MSQDTVLSIPHEPGAEREVLGHCLLSPESLSIATENLRPEDFFTLEHRRIFEAMLALRVSGSAVNSWAVYEALAGDAKVAEAGGSEFVSKLIDGITRASSVQGALQIVRSLAERRRLIGAIESAKDQLERPTATPQQIIDRVTSELDAIREGIATRKRAAMHVSEINRELTPVLARLGEGRGLMLGVSTGIHALDQIVPGFVPGEFLVLAARPSVGKSALASELSLRQAKAGNTVVFFSLEMSRSSVLLRMVCREGHVDFDRLTHGKLSTDGWRATSDALARVSRLPIWIDDAPIMNARDLRWRLSALAQRLKIRLAIVDYMQLLTANGETRYEKVTAISQELKAAAREIGEISGGTLIALSQLNRIAATEEPELHHLRESGQIEQDVDVALFLYDEKANELDSGGPVKVLKVAKQRNGPLDRIRLRYLKPCMGFEELA